MPNRMLRRFLWGGMTLILIVAVSLMVYYVRHQTKQRAQYLFKNDSEFLYEQSRNNLNQVVMVLSGIRGLFESSEEVTSNEWQVFLEGMRPSEKVTEVVTWVEFIRESGGGYRVGNVYPSEKKVVVNAWWDDVRVKTELAKKKTTMYQDLLNYQSMFLMPVREELGEAPRRVIGAIFSLNQASEFFLLTNEGGIIDEIKVKVISMRGDKEFTIVEQTVGKPLVKGGWGAVLENKIVKYHDQVNLTWGLVMTANQDYGLPFYQRYLHFLVAGMGILLVLVLLGWLRAGLAYERHGWKEAESLAVKLAVREKEMVAKAADPIVVIDKKGIVISVNEASVDLMGYPRRELEGKHISILSTDFSRVLKGDRGPFELEMVRKSDQFRVVVEVKVSEIKVPKVATALQLILRDVTERTRLMEINKREQEKTRSYLDVAGVMIVVLDKDGTVSMINKKGLEILGYTEEEVIGSDWFESYVPKEQKEEIRKVFEQIMAGKVEMKPVYEHENYVVAKSGEKRLLTFVNTVLRGEDGRITGTLSSGEDITKQREIQKERERLIVLQNATLEATADGILVVSGRQVTGFNKKLGEIWNVPRDVLKLGDDQKFVEKALPQLKDPDFFVNSMRKLENLQNESKDVIEFKDGRVYERYSTPQIVNNNIVGRVWSFRDVTHEKEIDRAKTEFVSMASHQLRTPLSVVNWYVELLQDESSSKLTAEQKVYLEILKVSNKRLVDLVNALLNVSRIEMGRLAVDPESVDLNELMKQVLSDLQTAVANKKVKLDYQSKRQLPKINLDRRLVGIVFANVIGNAVKYSKTGGKVIVSSTVDEKEVTVSVQDFGFGIPRMNQDKIFSKLYRADNAKQIDPEGTGLGLYIAKQIVESYGGKVWFKSEVEKGSTFFFTIPLSGMEKRIGDKNLINNLQ